jgi:hypothetical protein
VFIIFQEIQELDTRQTDHLSLRLTLRELATCPSQERAAAAATEAAAVLKASLLLERSADLEAAQHEHALVLERKVREMEAAAVAAQAGALHAQKMLLEESAGEALEEQKVGGQYH